MATFDRPESSSPRATDRASDVANAGLTNTEVFDAGKHRGPSSPTTADDPLAFGTPIVDPPSNQMTPLPDPDAD